MEDPDDNKKTIYSSPIAQGIEATSNFVNSVRNPNFIFALMAFAALIWIMYRGTESIPIALDKVAEKLDQVSTKLGVLINNADTQKEQNKQQIDSLNNIMNDLKESHRYRKHLKDEDA